VGILLLGPVGCRTTIPERPICPDLVLASVKRTRAEKPACGPSMTLDTATRRMRKNAPRILEARAAWRTAAALASTGTPLPNPTIGLGPLLVGGTDILSGISGVGWIGSLGWSVPLTNRIRLQNTRNAVLASAALTNAASVEREEYLGLRRDFLASMLGAMLLDAREELSATVDDSAVIAQKGVDAGSATALDVSLLRLEAATVRADLIASREALRQALGELGARMGSSATTFPPPAPSALPQLPPDVAPMDKLEKLVIRDNPRLATLRANYLVAEKELRLEYARRLPDLQLGMELEDEVDVQKLGIPLGIEIPLFDRNQQAVNQAMARRDEVRTRYLAALTEILADVENARARLLIRGERMDLLETQVGPAADTLKLAEEVRDQAGVLDMLRFLEVLRATRNVKVEVIQARAALYEAWSDLEEAVGAPLLTFQHEPGTHTVTTVRPTAAVPCRSPRR